MIEAALGDGRRFGRVDPLFAGGRGAGDRRRHRQRACRCSATSRFVAVNGDIFCDFDFAAPGARRAWTRDSRTWCWSPIRPTTRWAILRFAADAGAATRAPRWTFSGIGLYRPELFASVAARRQGQARAPAARGDGARAGDRAKCIAASGTTSARRERLADAERIGRA